jgi:hypothetical protein
MDFQGQQDKSGQAITLRMGTKILWTLKNFMYSPTAKFKVKVKTLQGSLPGKEHMKTGSLKSKNNTLLG